MPRTTIITYAFRTIWQITYLHHLSLASAVGLAASKALEMGGIAGGKAARDAVVEWREQLVKLGLRDSMTQQGTVLALGMRISISPPLDYPRILASSEM